MTSYFKHLQYTPHAGARMQQRGISPEVVSLVVAYGCHQWSHGAEKYFLDKKAHTRIRHAIGESWYQRIRGTLNVYVVVTADGVVVTAAHRLKPIKSKPTHRGGRCHHRGCHH